jgi:hypothetical protein
MYAAVNNTDSNFWEPPVLIKHHHQNHHHNNHHNPSLFIYFLLYLIQVMHISGFYFIAFLLLNMLLNRTEELPGNNAEILIILHVS